MKGKKVAAIVLAAGRGRRMESKIQKQYMELAGKPLVFYALQAFEKSGVDEIILVAGEGETQYCRTQIAELYGFSKVVGIVEGGRERYHSVYQGLKAIDRLGGTDIVLIHDGARPLITEEIIKRAVDGAEVYEACVVGMPVKDTIKIADGEGFAAETPKRELLWAVQTPQAFAWPVIWNAYRKLIHLEEEGKLGGLQVTDDAMVVETMTEHQVKLIPGSYENIKVTTPEDMEIAASLLRRIHDGA